MEFDASNPSLATSVPIAIASPIQVRLVSLISGVAVIAILLINYGVFMSRIRFLPKLIMQKSWKDRAEIKLN